MGSVYPTQNYWPQLQQLCHCQPHYVYVQVQAQEPNTDEYFHPFMKPSLSDPNPRSQIGSSNRLLPRPEICLQFKKGHCNYGSNCVFSHINPTPVNNNASFDCSVERQDLINKSRICFRGKECPYGDRCKFLHIPDSVRPVVNSVDEDYRMGFDGRKRRRFENSGSGERYMMQKYVDWRKTKLCTKWTEFGACPYGVNCCFAHGEEELRQVHVQPVNAFSASSLDNVTKDAAVPRKKSRVTVSENGKKDGKCYFKWNSIEKISQVYADWIDDLSPPVQLRSSLI